MRRGLNVVRALVEFIAGDDWLTAAGVAAALALTALAAGSGSGWWVMPLAVMVLLVVSLWRGTRVKPAARMERVRK